MADEAVLEALAEVTPEKAASMIASLDSARRSLVVATSIPGGASADAVDRILQDLGANPMAWPQSCRQVAFVDAGKHNVREFSPAVAGWCFDRKTAMLAYPGVDEARLRALAHEHLKSDPPAFARSMLSTLGVWRRTLGTRFAASGQLPDLTTTDWAQLGADNHKGLPVPLNPRSPDAVADLVVAGTDPVAVDPASAGWVWDHRNGSLYAAGVDERLLMEQLSRADRRSFINKLESFARTANELASRTFASSAVDPSDADRVSQLFTELAEQYPVELTNPFAGVRVASHVFQTTTQASVSSGAAGWIWNATSQRLIPTGLADDIQERLGTLEFASVPANGE